MRLSRSVYLGRARRSLGRLLQPGFWHARSAELRALPAALSVTLPWLIRTRSNATLLDALRRCVALHPHALALQMGDERLSWSDLDRMSSSVAHALRDHGVLAGDVVAVIGKNSPFYVGLVLGLCRLGAVAALVNAQLSGRPLAHAVRVSGARVALLQGRLAARNEVADAVRGAVDHVLEYGPGALDESIGRASTEAVEPAATSSDADFVFIYTSGTTGMPKPCRITHARALAAGSIFGPLVFEFRPGDKLYCVLPLYHSSALLLGLASCLITGTPMALRESLSVEAFFEDVRRYRATAFLYVGELCRYLVQGVPEGVERDHCLRIAVGNGLSLPVWKEMERRFRIPVIREFYGATEAPGALVNVTGKVGSVGHAPIIEWGRVRLVRYDEQREEWFRDRHGRHLECEPGEVGELLFSVGTSVLPALADFAGYTDATETGRKIATNVFLSGDRYYKSGDLMRRDASGHYYFVDRIGDSFRFKGENVSSQEVEQVAASAPGVLEAVACGVAVAGLEGRPGLVALVCREGFDSAAFFRHVQELPSHAQPRFVRIVGSLEKTATFKLKKSALRDEGVDPERISDPLYVRARDGYVRLTPALWRDILGGSTRL